MFLISCIHSSAVGLGWCSDQYSLHLYLVNSLNTIILQSRLFGKWPKVTLIVLTTFSSWLTVSGLTATTWLNPKITKRFQASRGIRLHSSHTVHDTIRFCHSNEHNCIFSIFEGALCSLEEDISTRRDSSSLAEFLFRLDKNTLCVFSVNKRTLKHSTV